MTAMSRVRRVLVVASLIGSASAVSAVLYQRSRSADFDHHARVVKAIAQVRYQDEVLSQEVLAARFGLVNQYDSVTAGETDLSAAAEEIDVVVGVAGEDDTLDKARQALATSIAQRRVTAERFKAENSILKNSLYYLPNVAREVELGLRASSGLDAVSQATHRVVETVLTCSIVGDDSSREAQLRARAELEGHRASVPAALRTSFDAVLAHAAVIDQKQASVDQRVRQVIDGDVDGKLQDVERVYNARFGATVVTSNRYRQILYGWSVALMLAVGAIGWLLRRSYADLERRVLERTGELREALSALWGEMKLARKIQEALLPASPWLANCEIAVVMKPTEDVGGDYYDIIRTPQAEWILIGDVSGHGVPAGLIMMMCQTAVRTVLRCNPDVLPDQLLAAVNAVLTQNIRQLGDDKYMTITALRRETGGVVYFAGAHQDLYIYRAKTDSVEALPTSGVWLGLKDHIDDMLVTRRFQLAAGDVLVLYTDGITEATRNGALFDTGGLQSVLERARGKTAKELLDEVFADLVGYRVADDATVLVMKQLESRVSSQSKLDTVRVRPARIA